MPVPYKLTVEGDRYLITTKDCDILKFFVNDKFIIEVDTNSSDGDITYEELDKFGIGDYVANLKNPLHYYLYLVDKKIKEDAYMYGNGDKWEEWDQLEEAGLLDLLEAETDKKNLAFNKIEAALIKKWTKYFVISGKQH